MSATLTAKKEFIKNREAIFKNRDLWVDAFKFSMSYSLLVEEYIRELAGPKKYKFAITSAGSFSRRELSPFSDIDIIFVTESTEDHVEDIAELVKKFWDNGIEASHTVREFSDIKKYIKNDLHTFTQFFEMRLLLGSESTYNEWNNRLFDSITDKVEAALIKGLATDISDRYTKYGASPKMLEPNIKLSAGGLRDFQAIEWMYILKNRTLLNKQIEMTQAEIFVGRLKEQNLVNVKESNQLLESYKFLLGVRNLLHVLAKQKNDRFEFTFQEKISEILLNSEKFYFAFYERIF